MYIEEVTMFLFILCIFIGLIAFHSNNQEKQKQAQEELKQAQEELNRIQNDLNSQKQKFEEKLSNLVDRENDLKKKEQEKENLEKTITSLKNELTEIDNEVSMSYKNSLPSTSSSLVDLNISDETTSSEIKNKLAILKDENTELVKNESVKIPFYIDSSRERNKLSRKVLIAFNSEVAGLLNRLTLANIDSIRDKIIKSFDRINKLFEDDNVQISTKYLEYQLTVLELNYQFILKKHNEKEQQAAIKEQMIDEAKAQKEVEREQRKIESEQRKFSNELEKTMKYLSKSNDSVQSEIYAEKIKELEEKIKQLDKDKSDINNRLLNTRAGYVYVISNIGSFGENIYKIGMTKRLNPLDRVNELGSASVPFRFDVHAMIFSEDAPKLENHLHKVFASKSVNKINSRKEFFNVSLKEIEKEVLDNFDATVEFTEFAKAEEYRRSLELSSNDMVN